MKRIKLFVRKNLKMSPGKIAAQCVHAALGLNQEYSPSLSPMLSVVVLEVSDTKFNEAKANITETGSAYVVSDAGYTEIAPGTETVLAFLEDDPRSKE